MTCFEALTLSENWIYLNQPFNPVTCNEIIVDLGNLELEDLCTRIQSVSDKIKYQIESKEKSFRNNYLFAKSSLIILGLMYIAPVLQLSQFATQIQNQRFYSRLSVITSAIALIVYPILLINFFLCERLEEHIRDGRSKLSISLAIGDMIQENLSERSREIFSMDIRL